MSLVCYVSNFGHPIIISDLILTDDSEIEPIHLPTLNKPYHELDFPDQFKPSDLRIKTIIIKENLCLSVTGVVSIIKRLINCAEDFFLHLIATKENLDRFCKENYDLNNNFNNCTAIFSIISLIDSKFVISERKFGAIHESENVHFGKVFTCGSGSSTWIEELSKQSAYLNSGSENRRFDMIGNLLRTCMYFLQKEKRSPENLRDGWGGGFDVVFASDGKFERLHNVFYGFWDIDITKPLSEWRIILKSYNFVYYKDKQMIVQAYNQENRGKNYIINELNKNLETDVEINMNDINARTVVVGLDVVTLNKPENIVWSIVEGGPNLITFFEDGEKPSFKIHEDLYNKILSIVKEATD